MLLTKKKKKRRKSNLKCSIQPKINNEKRKKKEIKPKIIK
jgi:hypothetical protein